MPTSHVPGIDAPPEQATQVAALFLDLVPVFFRMQRAAVRSGGSHDLSVPQVRTLRFIHRCPDVSLSDVASHLDMTLPATSKLIDRLLQLDLLTRAVDPQDRRRAVLHLSDAGHAWLNAMNQEIQAKLSARVADLPTAELEQCAAALTLLHELLVTDAGLPAKRL